MFVSASAPVVRARALARTYRRGVIAVPVLEAVDLQVAAGEWVAILGPSGSDKLAVALPHLSSQRTVLSWPAAGLALLISGLVGMVAGLGPANQAATLDPAAALRYE